MALVVTMEATIWLVLHYHYLFTHTNSFAFADILALATQMSCQPD